MPLVGRMFQSEVEDADKTNILIFTSVQLIRPDGTLRCGHQNITGFLSSENKNPYQFFIAIEIISFV